MKTLRILLTLVAWVSLTQEILSHSIKSSLSTAQHEHDVYSGNGKNTKHNAVMAHTGAILSPVAMPLPNIQVKTGKSSSSENSHAHTKKVVVMQSQNKVVSPTKSTSSSSAQNARNAANIRAPVMQMNHSPKKQPTPPIPNIPLQHAPTSPPQHPTPIPPPQQHSPTLPHQQSPPTPPPQQYPTAPRQQNPATPAASVQQKPKSVPSAIVTELSGQQYSQSAKKQPSFYNIPQGKHGLSNPVSLKMQSASTSVVVPELYIKDYYKPEPNQISHPILPIKDNLSNVVSITIRSAPHSARKLQKHKKVAKKVAKKIVKKVAKKIVKPVIHKKPKKLKPKKKPHVDIKAPVMVEPKPKRHPKRKHKSHSTVSVKYVHVLPSKPMMSDSSLSATHSYSHPSLVHKIVKTLKKTIAGVLPTKRDHLKLDLDHHSMFSY